MRKKQEKKPDAYRHEMKYPINKKQFEILKMRLFAVAALDPHVGENESYEIRSLYFDDLENRCYFENEDGTGSREKFRIRIYNGSTMQINLELKKKNHGKTQKQSCPLTKEQCERLMHGESLLWQEAETHPLLRKFFLQQQLRCLSPKVIVEYDRFPYVCPDGNVRITLDVNIRASGHVENFLGERILTRPIMPVGFHLLEIKYDDFLPDYFHYTLQMNGLAQTTFSKYYLCRKYISNDNY